MTKPDENKNRFLSILIPVLALSISIGFCLSPWGATLDRLAYDCLFEMRGPVQPPEEIVIVAVDEPSFGVLNQRWPWPRGLHARLIDSLFQCGARVVAFDLVFAEPSDPEQDRLLAEALARHEPVILAADLHVVQERRFVQEILVEALPSLRGEHTVSAVVNFPVDPDGFVRRFKRFAGGLPALATAAVALYWESGAGGKAVDRPAQETSEIGIPFLGPARTVPMVSYYQALEPEKHLPPETFQDKIVLVGLVTGTAADGEARGPEDFPVPFSRFHGGYMSGVEIHAQTAAGFLQDRAIRSLARKWALPLGLVTAMLLGWLFYKTRPAFGVVLWLAVSGAGAFICYMLFAHASYHVPASGFFAPFTALFLASPFLHYLKTREERNFIRNTFSKYLAPSVVTRLLEHPERLRLGGETVRASVLFLDVAGFTGLSERLPPDLLVRVLNRHLGAFSEIVFSWDGMVDKFIGDALMALWGIPIFQPDHAFRACSAALEMWRTARNATADSEFETRLSIRIGINSGNMVAGNVGGKRYFNYTVLGNEVNLASRLEGANKAYDTGILIGENTARLVEARFELRELDRIRVKGKKEAATVFELQAVKGGLDDRGMKVNERFAQGLKLYRELRWTEARRCFQQALALDPTDGPSRTYAARCEILESSPPPTGWDGVFHFDFK